MRSPVGAGDDGWPIRCEIPGQAGDDVEVAGDDVEVAGDDEDRPSLPA